MKLEWIELEGFRQYFSRQRLTFSKDADRRVTVIHGVNGAGKTSLFLALNWCLYGRIVDNITIIDNVGELVSKEAVARTPIGGKVQASVTVCFLHDGERYRIRRRVEVMKESAEIIVPTGYEIATMMRVQSDGQAIEVRNLIGMMNSILPANVRQYFLFDGEKIDNFAKPEAAAQVKQAIDLVLKLELLNRARYHLNLAATEYRKELKQKSSGELRKLIEQEEQARKVREDTQARIRELTDEIQSARLKIKDIDQKLDALPNAQALQKDRQRIERDLKQRGDEREKAVQYIRDLATTSHFILAQSAFAKALGVLDTKRERGEIPSSIRRQFVQDLLDEMKCICGRDIEAGSLEYQRLQQLMQKSISSKLENEVLDTTAALRVVVERVQPTLLDLRETMDQRVKLSEIIRDLEGEQSDVERQLKGSPLEEISRLEKNREEYRDDIERMTLEIGTCEGEVKSLNARIKNLEIEREKAEKAEARERLLSKKMEIAQRAADAIENAYQAHADDMRQRIEVKTKEIFKSLVWKESHFRDIQLGPDFNLEVIDRYGFRARPELSAGERQVLSLSFITAMSRVSGEEAPLVMDTPFGRLSSQPRDNITRYLPELTDQLILFVTDEELRGQSLENLKPRIGAEYRLEFNPDTSCTTIEEVK
jgi:DNA sulfur modification protein DndD